MLLFLVIFVIMRRFEYKTESGYMNGTSLNSLGKDGWELVSHTHPLGRSGNADENWVFKRELIELTIE